MCRSFQQRLADGWKAFNADAEALEARRECKKLKSQYLAGYDKEFFN